MHILECLFAASETMAEQQQAQEQLLQPQKQEQQLHGMAADAFTLLQQELNSQQPSISRASLILGILQQRLFSGQEDGQPLDAAVTLHAAKFQEQLVLPAAAKLGPKCKLTQVGSPCSLSSIRMFVAAVALGQLSLQQHHPHVVSEALDASAGICLPFYRLCW